jgi:protein-disulfide isomerase
MNSVSSSPSIAQAITSKELQEVTSTDDPSLGPEDAALVIVEFADFECPYSKDASYNIRSLLPEYEDSVRFIYRDFPISEIHPNAMLASEAAGCADDQGKFWEFHDRIYLNQSSLSEETISSHAIAIGLNINQFEACINSKRYEDEIIQDLSDGINAGVSGTPTFFFNGYAVPGSIPKELLRQIIDSFLER